eukprot:2280541-Rhodomonas_salina.1
MLEGNKCMLTICCNQDVYKAQGSRQRASLFVQHLHGLLAGDFWGCINEGVLVPRMSRVYWKGNHGTDPERSRGCTERGYAIRCKCSA